MKNTEALPVQAVLAKLPITRSIWEIRVIRGEGRWQTIYSK